MNLVDGIIYDSLFGATSKSDVGLSNVENTSDADKPISTATQLVFNGLDGNGVVSGMTLSINTDTTKFNISAGVYHSTVNGNVAYAGTLANVVTNIATVNVTYVAINASSQAIVQQTTPFSDTQRRTLILLGTVVHSNRTIINTVNNQPDVFLAGLAQLNDLMDGLNQFNIYGNIFSANGANLFLNKSIGKIYKKGIGFSTDTTNPNTKTMDALVAPSTIRYRLSDSTEYADTNEVSLFYESTPGVRTALPASDFSIQRIAIFPSNLVRIQYGQSKYNTIALARQAVLMDSFTVEQNISENGLIRGLLIVKGSCTDLSDATQALFIEVDKFGNAGGINSGGTTTLQQAYNNAVEPEILTNTTLGALTVQRGSATDSDNVIEVKNGAGGTTASINGSGLVSGINIEGLLSTATSAGTLTLTSESVVQQFFTGTTTHTAVMPVVSTLTLGRTWKFKNNSTGVITVNSSGGNLITTIPSGANIYITCIAITGTDATSWAYKSYTELLGVSGGQTITGGTLTTNRLTLKGNTVDLTTGGVTISDTTVSTNQSTGALIVVGGVGISGNLCTNKDVVIGAGGGLYLSSSNVVSGSSTSGGNLQLQSTSNVTKGQVKVIDTTNSTSSTTGAFYVAGGFGLAKDGYIGGVLNTLASVNKKITSITNGTTTLDATHDTIMANATSGIITINLPAVSGITGREYTVKKTDTSTNAVTIDANASETIDGNLTLILNKVNDFVTIRCDGSSWKIVAESSRIYCEYTRGSTQTINNNTHTAILYATKVVDTHSAYNAGTGVFTVPMTGVYVLSGAYTYGSETLVVGEKAILSVYKNSVYSRTMDTFMAQAAVSAEVNPNGSTQMYLTAGDLIEFRAFQDSGSSKDIIADASHNYFSIVKLA